MEEMQFNLYLGDCRIFIISFLSTKDAGTDADNDYSDEEDWMWNLPLTASTIVNADDAAESPRKFTAEAVKPLAMQLEVDKSSDLKQMLRRYKYPSFDLTRPLCVEIKVTREGFLLGLESLMAVMVCQDYPQGSVLLGIQGHEGVLS